MISGQMPQATSGVGPISHLCNFLVGLLSPIFFLLTMTLIVSFLEPKIFHFHRKPKRNLGFEAELPVRT